MIQFNPDRLVALIEIRKWTETKLAQKSGYSRQVINKWTRGLSVPKIEALTKFCEIGDVHIGYFFPEPPAPYVPAKKELVSP